MLREVWPFVGRKRAAGQPVVLLRLVGRDGPGARPLGATMAVAADGDWTGSVAGGCVEGMLLDEARAVLAGDGPRVIELRIGAELLPWEPGPACRSTLRILVTPAPDGPVAERVTAALGADLPLRVGVELRHPYRWTTGPGPDRAGESVEDLAGRPVLIIVGGTDLAAVLAALAVPLGRRVVVVDPRPEYARAGRVPLADEVVCAWPDAWLGEHPPSPRDAVLVLTHDPRIDDRALQAALPGPAGHVAVLGSRETHRERLSRLAGTPGLDRLAGPAGLDLGAGSTVETALSLLAEVVAVANARFGGRLSATSGPIRAGLREDHPAPSEDQPGPVNDPTLSPVN
ncbi:XdhC family protein [Actinoplanes sp. NPDC089786]|uniref:XdhC family protein n=1 Tax=Actinoplanes sp. NPDC089786 TaxID=3155185 RepID=UPI00343FBDDD